MFTKFFKRFFSKEDLREFLIKNNITKSFIDKSLQYSHDRESLKKYWIEFLKEYETKLEIYMKPHVLLFSGVNGSGKTTTIGKLIRKWKDQYKIKVVAGDTFRYAASQQLLSFSDNCEFITQDGVHPATLVYKALDNNTHDIILIDTAGRLSNNDELLAQLSKIGKSILKHTSKFEHIIIIDGTCGKNSIQQYEKFNNACTIDKVIITKLDGRANGSIVFDICDRFKSKIAAICYEEDGISDFSSEVFVEQLI